MRRNVRSNQHGDDYPISTAHYHNTPFNEADLTEDFLQMGVISARTSNNTHRFENTIEAKVEPGDTLQAIALRFHCTVADIKRMNKIDKDNEIHARKVVKIPVTVHNVILENLPIVHKSGNSSPKAIQKSSNSESRDSNSGLSSIVHNPLEDAEAMLSVKLMVASVNSSELSQPSISREALLREKIDNNISNTKLTSRNLNFYTDKDLSTSNLDDASSPLIADVLDDLTNVPKMHRIRGPSLRAIDWSGSDCDMSWVCLFIVILALCFVIPLVYVFYIAEHYHHNITGSTHH